MAQLLGALVCLFSQRSCVWFPVPTFYFTAVHNSNLRGSETCLLASCGHKAHTCTQTCTAGKTPIQVNLFKKLRKDSIRSGLEDVSVGIALS